METQPPAFQSAPRTSGEQETKPTAEASPIADMFVRDLQQSKTEMAMSSFGGRAFDIVEHERWAAVILDGMYQFVALLNPKGDILEVNRAALEGAGHRIEEIRGKPFWTARWWQVSEQVREDLQAAIRRAAAGEFVRYEVDI